MKVRNRQHLIIAIFAIFIVQIACGQQSKRVQLNGYSMEPNFPDGTIFTIEDVSLSEMERGDLVLVELNGTQIIKRLIGLPNETVAVHDGKVFINGEVLVESYEVIPPIYTLKEIALDSDSYFILGDNRPDSKDSHSFGPIKSSNIKGRAIP